MRRMGLGGGGREGLDGIKGRIWRLMVNRSVLGGCVGEGRGG